MDFKFNENIENINVTPIKIEYINKVKHVRWKCSLCESIKITRFDYFLKMVNIRKNLNKIFCDECDKHLIYVGMRLDKIMITNIIYKDLSNNNKFHKAEYDCICGNKGTTRTRILLDKIYKHHSTSFSCGKCGDRMSSHIHYKRAKSILERCTVIHHKSFKDYGGRGIENRLGDTIVEIIHSISKVPGYQDGYQIDRVDNDGHYTIVHPIHGDKVWEDEYGNKCLGNLRWVSPVINSSNRRTSVTLESLATTPRDTSLFMKIISKERMVLLGLNNPDDYSREFVDYRVTNNSVKPRYIYIHKSLLKEK